MSDRVFIKLGKEHNEVIVGPTVSKTDEEFKVNISEVCPEYFDDRTVIKNEHGEVLEKREADFQAICKMLKEFLKI